MAFAIRYCIYDIGEKCGALFGCVKKSRKTGRTLARDCISCEHDNSCFIQENIEFYPSRLYHTGGLCPKHRKKKTSSN